VDLIDQIRSADAIVEFAERLNAANEPLDVVSRRRSARTVTGCGRH